MCWSDQYFCLVHATYESKFLEYLDKFVVEPIDDIPISSMFVEIRIEHWTLVLDTFGNYLCVITRYVFWMLEVTLSGSCAYVERCRSESEQSFIVSSVIISIWSCTCEAFLRWKVVTFIP